jgi:hypothetical protein
MKIIGLLAFVILTNNAYAGENNPCTPCPYPLPYGSNCPSAGVVAACERSKYATEYRKSVMNCGGFNPTGLSAYWKEGCK